LLLHWLGGLTVLFLRGLLRACHDGESQR
jgi:hypothetical protein